MNDGIPVDHGILCKKLEYYCILEQQLAWFKSYLANRKQFSRVNGIDSKVEEINVGVPEGSCLGPLLFLIYINDLPRFVPGSRVSMYTDDTSVCHQSFDIAQMNEAINSDLAQVEKWLKGNKLSLNVMKTHAMLISTKPKHKTLKNQGESLKLKIQNDELDVVQKTKYLGVQIDNKLDWKEHIKTVSLKVSRAIGFLKHAKSFLPEKSLRAMYTGIVEPHFRYCCSIWGCCGLTEINRLQKLQNRAARIITGSRFDSPGLPLVKRLGWKTIDELINSESNIMVFISLHGLALPYMRNLFTKTSQLTLRNLRNSATDLRMPKKKIQQMGRNVSLLEVLNLGMASQPSVSRHPLFINSKNSTNSRCKYVFGFHFIANIYFRS